MNKNKTYIFQSGSRLLRTCPQYLIQINSGHFRWPLVILQSKALHSAILLEWFLRKMGHGRSELHRANWKYIYKAALSYTTKTSVHPSRLLYPCLAASRPTNKRFAQPVRIPRPLFAPFSSIVLRYMRRFTACWSFIRSPMKISVINKQRESFRQRRWLKMAARLCRLQIQKT